MQQLNFKKYILPAILLAAFLISLLKPGIQSTQNIAVDIQTKLNYTESLFYQAFDKIDPQSLQQQGLPPVLVKQLYGEGIFLYWFQQGELKQWTTNTIPFSLTPASLLQNTSLIRTKNGWYQAMKWTSKTTNDIVIGLQPVKYAYPFQNNFLRNDFALGLDIPGNIELSEQIMEGLPKVSNLEGQTLFTLYTTSSAADETISYTLLLAQITLIILLLFYIHRFSLYVNTRFGYISSTSLFILLLTTLRAIMLWFNVPGQLYKLPLFDPAYYASTIVTKSLGDLAVNTFLFVWVVFFFLKHKPDQFNTSRSMRWGGLVIIYLYTALILWVFKTLVMDSVVSFEIYNILSLDTFSLLGLICLALLMLGHFAVVRIVVSALAKSETGLLAMAAACTALGLCFAVPAITSEFREAIIYTAVWISCFVFLLTLYFKNTKTHLVRSALLGIAVYSILSTVLIENLYERKERNSRAFFSGKLVSERDFIAEYTFGDIATRIKQDEFIRHFFSNPILSQKEIFDRINVLYLGGYFNKYNFQLYTYDATGTSVKNADTLRLDYLLRLFEQDTAGTSVLRYISDSALNYSYLSIIPIYNDSNLAGTLAVRLTPKIYYGQNVYPELLLGSNLTVSNNSNNYSYAIYQHDKLIAQYGEYPYTYYWNKNYTFNQKDFRFIEEKEWELSIQRFANGKKVIVVVAREPVFEPIATFSYLFSFFILFLAVLIPAYRVISSPQQIAESYHSLLISLRARINFSMLLMILVSFIVIGFVTISFFSRQYDNFYTDRLLRKEKVIHASLEYYVQKNTMDNEHLDGELGLEIARLADINSIDINLFDRNGNLAISSQPVIYDKGIVSRKMNPEAYAELENNKTSQVIEHEQIGNLSYLATYTPVRNYKGEAIAYLGIPYFERSKNINDEVSSFLVALMNVYVFLLICAAILAYFISNSVTRPLTIISDKLRILNLNKKNEPIEWKSNDEIGVLVSEYNKMINELEHSAQQLAKNERESAWREMAKQIAHEIKNPLTPMKLSIQYLQRAIDDGNPNISVLAKKVARTLEEQIENLSSIATAFSSFAKMPKAQNEIINLNELLRPITELFASEETATITFTTDSALPLIFADKNQLVSVFNNLVKNAIQSIPENRKGFIDVHLKDEDGWVIVSVSDNGNGIIQNNYDKVFVPNFTTKSSGTGLGLAITKQIIDGAGGKIWFETAENVGTTFFVKLLKSKA